MIQVKVKKLLSDAIIPAYQHPNGDSGVDLYSIEEKLIHSHQRALIHTGLAMAIPEGYEGCIRPRSGNALKLGLTVLNTPGTIDANYRGEIGIILYNSSVEPVKVSKGDRVAQMVFQKIPRVEFLEVSELDDTDRNNGGFGSTGK